ncbi:MAG: tail fiber domain-containing protein [Bacteroidia bacterium]
MKRNHIKIIAVITVAMTVITNVKGQVSIPPPTTLPAGWAGAPACNVPGWSGTFVGNFAGSSNANANFNSAFGYRAGFANTGQGNSFFGYEAGHNSTTGASNLFIGAFSGLANTSGGSNTYVGTYCADNLLTGSNNTLVGAESGRGFSSGTGNCFVGYKVGYNSSTNTSSGNNNTFMGGTAGTGHISGDHNTYYGFAAGYFNQTGKFNTSLGSNSGCTNLNATTISRSNWTSIGYSSVTNSQNATAIGYYAMVGSSSDNSTAIGCSSIVSIPNGMQLGHGRDRNGALNNYKVGIGTDAPVGNFHVADMNLTATGSTDIRFEDLPVSTDIAGLVWNATTGRISRRSDFVFRTCSTSGFIPLWNSSGSLACSIIQQGSPLNCSGIATNAVAIGGAPLGCATPNGGNPTNMIFAVYGNSFSSGGNWTVSDKKFKTNIIQINNSLELVKKLKGFSYEYKVEEYKDYNFKSGKSLGFIAQEVKEVIPEAVMELSNGTLIINYDMIIPLLSEAIKDQQIEIETKNQELNLLKDEMSIVKQKQVEFENILSNCCSDYQAKTAASILNNDQPKLEQNSPNPFNQKTIIKYYIPLNTKLGFIKIYSLNGVELQSYEISNTGIGSIEINANTLSIGTYIYHLVLDNNYIDAKLMMLTK